MFIYTMIQSVLQHVSSQRWEERLIFERESVIRPERVSSYRQVID